VNPTRERIVFLDALRGFAVLGILLMNILAFGLPSPSYSYPGFDVDPAGGADRLAWILVELFGEGSMRGLFSLLFGAGLLLFTTGPGAKGTATHYRRMFFLLLFGLVDAYLLLWFGDILICYAICGALLYPLRNWRARSLLLLAALIAVLSSLSYGALNFGLQSMQEASRLLAATADPTTLEPWVREAAKGWEEFAGPYQLGTDALAEELRQRGGSYASAFRWNLAQSNAMLFFVTPLFLLWDALLMMLLGMALYRLGVLSGDLSRSAAGRLAALGLIVGIGCNAWEVQRALAADLSLVAAFAQTSVTYHVGRIAMTLGYAGLLASLLATGRVTGPLRRLAAVGRMALTNYLMHSLIALLLFTGAGLGLIGVFSRSELYGVVLAIWVLQLWLSPRWLARHDFGPLEYLWRRLTYGQSPQRA
jgi:uncharacterized protein